MVPERLRSVLDVLRPVLRCHPGLTFKSALSSGAANGDPTQKSSTTMKQFCDLSFLEHIFRLFFLSERIKKLHLSSHYLVVVEEKITDSAGACLTPAREAPPQSPQIQIQTDIRLHLPGS